MEFTKDEKELLLQMIGDYWDNQNAKNFINHRRKRVSDRIVKKLNLPVVSNNERSDVAVCDHNGTTITWGPDNDKCTKCGLTWPV